MPCKTKWPVSVPAARGGVVLIISCVLPLPLTEDGLKLQLLRLPAGVMTHEAGLKAMVPVYPFVPLMVSVTGAELCPGAPMTMLLEPRLSLSVKSCTPSRKDAREGM